MNVKLQDLRNEVALHKLDPNYQFNALSPEEFLEKAKQSWAKTPENQQNLVKKSWQKAVESALGIKISDLDKDGKDNLVNELIETRFLAQTNLFFMCHLIGYKDMTIQTHEDICNKFFVQKDPTFVTMEKFAKTYDDSKKRRMLLVPRNGFKSTMDMADCVQWTICFPETTMLIMTGTLPLATAFVKEIREHFELENSLEADAKGRPIYVSRNLKNKDTGEASTSLFQIMFAEHCIIPGSGKQGEYITPACVAGSKEPTVRAASIEQTLSGFHFEVLKLDDVVTNENSTTQTRIEHVNKQISINRGMLNPYGFIDVIGTAYDENDFYAQILKEEQKQSIIQGRQHSIIGTIDDGKYNSDISVVCYVRACWQVKPESKDKAETELLEDDYIFWFPERLTYKWLMNEKADEDGFAIKYLNDPRKRNRVKFSREMLVKKTIPYTQMPQGGVVVTAVDMAYSGKPWADYTVILTAVISGGRFYITNMDRGRWSEYESPKHIAAVAYNQKPKHIAIEENMGGVWLRNEVQAEMAKFKIQVPLRSVPLGKGSSKTSKAAKAKPVVRMFGDDRIYLMQSCAGLEEIYTELSLFTGTKDDKHDDIVSAISLLVDQFGSYANLDGAPIPQQMIYSDALAKEKHDLVYGLGKYAAMGDDNPATMYQVENAQSIMSSTVLEAFSDPLADAGLF